jgi:hypothetical protein
MESRWDDWICTMALAGPIQLINEIGEEAGTSS